jgi:hypothetical protein
VLFLAPGLCVLLQHLLSVKLASGTNVSGMTHIIVRRFFLFPHRFIKNTSQRDIRSSSSFRRDTTAAAAAATAAAVLLSSR